MASGDTGNVFANSDFTEGNTIFSDERSATRSSQRTIDPDLARIASAWPSLPAVLRAGILAMVSAASPARASKPASKPKARRRR
jgi:hypothetical protein